MKTTIISGHDEANFSARQFILDLAENPGPQTTHVIYLAEEPLRRSLRRQMDEISAERGVESTVDYLYLQGLSAAETYHALGRMLRRADQYSAASEGVRIYFENPLRWVLRCPTAFQKTMRRKIYNLIASASRQETPLSISLKINSLIEFQALCPREMKNLTRPSKSPDVGLPIFFLLPNRAEIFYEQITAGVNLAGTELDGDDLLCLPGTRQAFVSSCTQWLLGTAPA